MVDPVSRRGAIAGLIAGPAMARSVAAETRPEDGQPDLQAVGERLDRLETRIEGAAGARAGPEDAGRLVRLGADGFVDPSLLSPGAARRDILAFGAVWDGKSHPLSERFPDLEAARRVYPHATDMSDEIDWAATQAAVNRIVRDWAEGAAPIHGGVVELPSGSGRFNRALTLPYRSIYGGERAPAVSLRGQGRIATGMVWETAVDAIEGAAIRFRAAQVSRGGIVWREAKDPEHVTADCELADFFMLGPGYFHGYPAPESRDDFIARYGFDAGEGWARAYNAGRPAIGMIRGDYDGIALPDRVTLRGVSIEGFHAGLRVTGGQRLMERVRVFNCYYAMFLERNAAHHGDFVLVKCDLSGRFACVGLAPEATWFANSVTTIFNQSPYAFYKLASAEVPTDAAAVARHGDHWPGIVQFSSFLHCQFESIGNTVFADGNPAPRHRMQDVAFETCACVEALDCHFPETDRHPAGRVRRRASFLDVAEARAVTLTAPADPARWPVRAAVFRTEGAFDASRIDGIDGLIEAASASGARVFEVGGALQGREILLRGRDWVGFVARTQGDGPPIARGDLLGLGPRGVEAHDASRPGVLGVAQESAASGAACLCVAEVSGAPVAVNAEVGTGAPRAGIDVTCSAATPGKVWEARPGEAVIGRAIEISADPPVWRVMIWNPGCR